MHSRKVLAIIPARGGSKGIPRKNVRFLAGTPLLAYSIRNAQQSELITRVVVSTDDDEIAHVAEVYGCEVVPRPAELARDDVNLDPVIHHALTTLEADEGARFDLVVTLQVTSPLLTPESIDRAIEQQVATGADTVIAAVDDRHLAWTKVDGEFTPLYEARLNRQYLPANFRETGGVVVSARDCVTPESRIGPKVDLFEVSARESIDIDTQMDWWLAEKLLQQKRVLIRADGDTEIGLGHVYRGLLLAGRLINHELLFVTRAGHALGVEMLEASFFPMATFETDAEYEAILDRFDPHIVINDVLDTTAGEVQRLRIRGHFVVNFEDMGPGAEVADLVINALYERVMPAEHVFWSKDFYCLREEFLLLPPKVVEPEVREVLLTFGGTDANDYTARVLGLLAGLGRDLKVTVIAGLGYPHLDALEARAAGLPIPVEILRNVRTISRYMHRADVIFTSAGRTVYEVASLGTPVIVLAQNNRELLHTFAHATNGVINLGLGTQVADADITSAFERLADDVELRRRCNRLMLDQDLRSGLDNVLKLIFSRYAERERKAAT